jgi:hypothetical protein
MSEEQKPSPDQAQAFDSVIFQLVLWALGQRGVDHVAVVRLQANVQHSQHRKDLVDYVVAQGIIHVLCDHKVLQALQELHGKEEEHPTCQICIFCFGMNPPSTEQAHPGKGERRFLVEAHDVLKKFLLLLLSSTV